MASEANIKAISIGLLGFLGIGLAVVLIDQARLGDVKSAFGVEDPAAVEDLAAADVTTQTPNTAPGSFDGQVVTSTGTLSLGDVNAEGAAIQGTTAASSLPSQVSPDGLTAAERDAAALAIENASAGVPNVTTEGVSISNLAPSIDTFFRNPDETTVIAGRAVPGQTVAIILGGEELDRVVTAADGTFGAVVFISASDQPRRLQLVGDPDGQELVSAESVIVPPSAPVAVAVATPSQQAPTIGEAGETDEQALIIDDEASRIAVGITLDETTSPDVKTESPSGLGGETGVAPEVSAPPTLIADADGVRVIQPSEGSASQPELVDNVALDAITYDPTGEVTLSGRADADSFVQIYLDNQPITTSRISDQGDWSIDLPNVDTGVYTLRVDEVDADGNVQSRIETPFKREERETVAAIMAAETEDEDFDLAVKTVQPGNTLWAIAEERFGEGIMYVAVFEANKDLIRDPDLIYPGQVFRLPDAPE